MPEAAPQTRGLAARLLRDWLGFEFVSRIYLYSALIGLISGLGAVLFTYGLELAKFLLVEKLAGYRQIHPTTRRYSTSPSSTRPPTASTCGCCFCCQRWAVCSAAT